MTTNQEHIKTQYNRGPDERKQTRVPRRHALLVLAIASLVRCAGPQPLDRAIKVHDENAYVEHLNEAGLDARQAYLKWMSAERNESIRNLEAEDAALSTTRNPFDAYDDPQAVSRGAVIFKMHCARCHGEDVRGHGPAVLPDYPAKDFHSFGKRFASTLHRGAPRKWFRVISEGAGDTVTYPDGENTAMPAFGQSMTREQIWLVITYLQSLDMHAR